jgi:hypothetical protein
VQDSAAYKSYPAENGVPWVGILARSLRSLIFTSTQ